MTSGMDHDRNAQTLVPTLDIRIRGSNHEPTLNGWVSCLMSLICSVSAVLTS